MSGSETDSLRIADRLAIEAALHRYTRGMDRRDWALARTAYHVDAEDHHGDYRGGIDGFIARSETRHRFIIQAMHRLSNIFIEFDGPDGAVVESYFISFQRHAAAAGEARRALLHDGAPLGPDDDVETFTIGRYADRFTRKDGEWRIFRRLVVYEGKEATAVPADRRIKPNWAIGTRDGADPVQRLRRDVGLPDAG